MEASGRGTWPLLYGRHGGQGPGKEPGFPGLRSWAGMTQGVACLCPAGPKATSRPAALSPPQDLRLRRHAHQQPRRAPGHLRSSSPNHSALQHHLATFPLRPAPGLTNNNTSDWPGAHHQSKNSVFTLSRLRAPRCVLGLVGAANMQRLVINLNRLLSQPLPEQLCSSCKHSAGLCVIALARHQHCSVRQYCCNLPPLLLSFFCIFGFLFCFCSYGLRKDGCKFSVELRLNS